MNTAESSGRVKSVAAIAVIAAIAATAEFATSVIFADTRHA